MPYRCHSCEATRGEPKRSHTYLKDRPVQEISCIATQFHFMSSLLISVLSVSEKFVMKRKRPWTATVVSQKRLWKNQSMLVVSSGSQSKSAEIAVVSFFLESVMLTLSFYFMYVGGSA